MTDAKRWIDTLNLTKHPEGGHFRETYRSEDVLTKDALPARFTGSRACSTAIYYLLNGDEFSALHRIKQDEVWHFYDGSSITIHIIDPQGEYTTIQLGRNVADGGRPQAVVKAGCSFGATVDDTQSYALVGCTVAPGFDFADFEMPTRAELCRLYPQHLKIIERLSR